MSDITLEGVDKLTERLDSIVDTDSLKGAMGKACAIVERSAKQKAPKDNGTLINSIESRVEEANGDIQGVVFTTLEYSSYVEYGTGLFAEKGGRQGYWVFVKDSTQKSKNGGKVYTLEEAKQAMAIMRRKGLQAYYTNGRHPHPFMRPALNENRTQILRILGEALTND